MVSATICMEILKFANASVVLLNKKELNPQDEGVETFRNATTKGGLFRALLARYPMANIEAALLWLDYCDYISEHQWGLFPTRWLQLTPKGIQAADCRRLDDADTSLLYQEEKIHQVFIAHQFNTDDSQLVSYLRTRVLEPAGFQLADGRAEGLEDFRTSILANIQRSRFFLCLITQRVALATGSFVSSVWLYQETGVAVAYGKKPLLLVEEGIDSKFVGELQSIYEHIPFNRSNHPAAFDKVLPRLKADLKANYLPLPTPPA